MKHHFNLQKNHQIIAISQSGGTLLWISFMLLLISSLAAGILKFANTSGTAEISAHSLQKAYYLAQSGGNYAVSYLLESDSKEEMDARIEYLNNIQQYKFVNEGDFSLIIEEPDTDPILIHSTGTANRGSYFESQVELTFRLGGDGNGGYAIYSFGKVTIDEDSSVDAYDSTNGAYNSPYGDPPRKNRDENAGDVATGGGSDKTDIDEDAKIGGNVLHDEPEPEFDKDLDSIFNQPFDSHKKLNKDISKTIKLNDQKYFSEENLSLKENATLEINGNVTLIVNGDFEAGEKSKIILKPGATLTLYVKGDVKFDEVSEINEGGIPGNFKIFSTGEEVEIKESKIYAAIYAPDAKIEIDEGELYGAVIGNEVELEEAKIHYDKALGRDGKNNSPPKDGQIQYFRH